VIGKNTAPKFVNSIALLRLLNELFLFCFRQAHIAALGRRQLLSYYTFCWKFSHELAIPDLPLAVIFSISLAWYHQSRWLPIAPAFLNNSIAASIDLSQNKIEQVFEQNFSFYKYKYKYGSCMNCPFSRSNHPLYSSLLYALLFILRWKYYVARFISATKVIGNKRSS